MSASAMAIGCDVVDVARLGALTTRRQGFATRVFTTGELADCTRGGVALDSPVAHARLAARFAAKEATRKALGDLRLPFHAVEVRRADDGAPRLHVHGRPSTLACSLSHDGGVAMAMVVGIRPAASGEDDSTSPHDLTAPAAPQASQPSATTTPPCAAT